MTINFDNSQFPTVTMTFYAPITERDIHEACISLSVLIARKRRFFLVSDMTHGSPSMPQGYVMSTYMNANRDAFRTYLHGNCIVIESPVVRGALRKALLAFKPPFPTSIEATLYAAVEKIRKMANESEAQTKS